MFQFPNWSIQLPGYSYDTHEPDAFAHCEVGDRNIGATSRTCAFSALGIGGLATGRSTTNPMGASRRMLA